MKKKLTIKDFAPVIPLEQIREKLGKREFDKFVKWIEGQTLIDGGVFVDDLERFLNNKPIID